MKTLLENYRIGWQDRRLRNWFLTALAIFITEMIAYSKFLRWADARAGVRLEDPLLSILPTIECSWLIFVLIYIPTVWTLLRVVPRPKELLHFGIGYIVLTGFRMLAMTLVPLEAPLGTLDLVDPVAQFMQTSSHPLTRDLFFSGHTATVSLLVLYASSKLQKNVSIAALCGVMCGVLLQKVHYSIDVFVAPFFAYAAYRISHRLMP